MTLFRYIPTCFLQRQKEKLMIHISQFSKIADTNVLFSLLDSEIIFHVFRYVFTLPKVFRMKVTGLSENIKLHSDILYDWLFLRKIMKLDLSVV